MDRDRREGPAQWVERVQDAMRTSIPKFSARRAVKEAAEKLYNPSAPHV